MSELFRLTGFREDHKIAEILNENPRAYMALRGAIAEKHLENQLEQMLLAGDIREFKKAAGDFEKDFYVKTNKGTSVTLECKNVQVLNISSKKLKIDYLRFLFENGYIETPPTNNPESLPMAKLDKLISELPQAYRESGLSRYHFSESMLREDFAGDEAEYLHLFDQYPLSIDFQRTRNSRGDGADGKENRFYRIDEIDYVGACLFSRTLSWSFIFAHSSCFPVHPNFPGRYSNSLKIEPEHWHRDLIRLFEAHGD